MASTLSLVEIQTRISDIRTALDAAEAAASYGKGDKQVARQSVRDLQLQLNRYLRDERQLLATQSGANNSGIITAGWS